MNPKLSIAVVALSFFALGLGVGVTRVPPTSPKRPPELIPAKFEVQVPDQGSGVSEFHRCVVFRAVTKGETTEVRSSGSTNPPTVIRLTFSDGDTLILMGDPITAR